MNSLPAPPHLKSDFNKEYSSCSGRQRKQTKSSRNLRSLAVNITITNDFFFVVLMAVVDVDYKFVWMDIDTYFMVLFRCAKILLLRVGD